MTQSCLYNLCRLAPDLTLHPCSFRWALAIVFAIVFNVVSLVSQDSCLADDVLTPFQRALTTPKGMLESPYRNSPGRVAEEGRELYRALDCSGCHGGGGGGGMAVPLTNPVWIYGNDDDTLFRVITLGTGSLSPGDAFQNQGYKRKGSEAVVGPMPHYGDIIKRDDEVWKIIAWIRSTSLSDD